MQREAGTGTGKNSKRVLSLYLNEGDAKQEFGNMANALLGHTMQQMQEIVGITSSTAALSRDPYHLLYQESTNKLARIMEASANLFTVQHQSNLIQQLRKRRQAIEQEMATAVKEIAERGEVSMTVNELKQYITSQVFDRCLSELNYQHYYTSASSDVSKTVAAEIDDLHELLQRFYQSLLSAAIKEYETRYAALQERANLLFKENCEAIQLKIPELIQTMSKQHSKGYPKSLVLFLLDKEYQKRDEEMKQTILSWNNRGSSSTSSSSSSPIANEVHTLFYEFCHHLQDLITRDYEKTKEEAFIAVFQQSESDLNAELNALTGQWERELQDYLSALSLESNTSSPSKELNSEEIFATLDQLVDRIWKSSVAQTIGWLSDSVSSKEKLTDYQYLLQETLFGKKLHQFLSNNLTPFKEELKVIFGQIEEQKKEILRQREEKKNSKKTAPPPPPPVEEEEEEEEEDGGTIAMEEDDYDYDEEEEEEEEVQRESEDDNDIATRHVFQQVKSNRKGTVEEQRRRAKDFAERVLGLSFSSASSSKGKKANNNNSKKQQQQQLVNKKSLAKQREDAKAFAVKAFGKKILEKDSESEGENSGDNNNRGGRKPVTAGNNPNPNHPNRNPSSNTASNSNSIPNNNSNSNSNTRKKRKSIESEEGEAERETDSHEQRPTTKRRKLDEDNQQPPQPQQQSLPTASSSPTASKTTARSV